MWLYCKRCQIGTFSLRTSLRSLRTLRLKRFNRKVRKGRKDQFHAVPSILKNCFLEVAFIIKNEN